MTQKMMQKERMRNANEWNHLNLNVINFTLMKDEQSHRKSTQKRI